MAIRMNERLRRELEDGFANERTDGWGDDEADRHLRLLAAIQNGDNLPEVDENADDFDESTLEGAQLITLSVSYFGIRHLA